MVARRRFLLSALGTAGALVVGWAVTPPAGRLGSASSGRPVALNGWVRIGSDGVIEVIVPRSEMGQGVSTALPMLVAEELDVALAQVRTLPAPDEPMYGNVAVFLRTDADPQYGIGTRLEQWFVAKIARDLGVQITGGSSSVRDCWVPMRQAGAAARHMIIEAAARRWQVSMSDCSTADGVVTGPDGRSLSYGELAQEAARLAPPPTIELKPFDKFRLIGQPISRSDSAAKVGGSAVYGIDVRLPGMLHAAVRGCPLLGGSLRSFDPGQAPQMPGVKRIIAYPGDARCGCRPGIAAVARSHWQAEQALAQVRIDWSSGAGAPPEGADLVQAMRRGLDGPAGWVFVAKGDAMAALGSAARVVQAEYEAPWLAHATIEPMNCTAQLVDGRLKLWTPTQAPTFARWTAARVAGIPVKKIDLTITQLGGGFGRRLESDFIVPAVQLAAQFTPAPVQVLWSREEDFTHDFYRPAAVARFRGAIDASGRVFAWVSRTASDAVGAQFLRRALPLPDVDTKDSTAAEGHFDQAYEFDHQHCSHVRVASPVPIGNWRSVGHSHNAFFTESFIDELAHAAGTDALRFRLDLLQRRPRHRAVLQLAGQKAGWENPLPAHLARGIALHESFGSIVAQVVEISLKDEEPVVHRVVCAIDCGVVVNPKIVEQQIEGAVNFGLGAALRERITIHQGRIEQRNFPQYPLLRIGDSPVVETYIVQSERPPTGVGEIATPPIAPAVAAALFALTGARRRSLPLIAATGSSRSS
ncbi:MAG: xanthine dehydrogenase family protein molybdopterin-binding subunit [Burkholderiaceae bacterium]|nr:xanthine dehydrogenase family protein molybdopterin-binding subunit [Burkholderiaceae bacterium]